MDIIKPPKKSMYKNKAWISAMIVALIILLSYANSSFNQVTLIKKDLLLSQVQTGELAISVAGYGKLVSDKQQIITALSRSTVREILLKPGALVSKDSVIVKLANPELAIHVEDARQQLAQLNANLRQLKVNQKRELLTEQATLEQLSAQYESAKLKRQAEQKLIKSGIISEIAFKQSQLNETQLNKRINILSKRLDQLSLVHQEAVNIQLERIKQQQGQLSIALNYLDKLNVTAGLDGVLQRLSVNLGQSLSPGQEIALIGSINDIIAEIKIPQNQAPKVKVGQQVTIDTRQDVIRGIVSRIDPIVEQNTVKVDVSLPVILPSNTRPEQNIDAQIVTQIIKNATFIERPANLPSHTTQFIYQVNDQGNLANRVQVSFGEKTNQYIEITSKVNKDQWFIISDLSNYQTKHIKLN